MGAALRTSHQMERQCLYFFMFLFLLPASECYNTRFKTSFKNMSLFPLDTDGLVGRYAGAWNNATNRGISFQLWLLSYDSISYFLSVVAMHNSGEAWELRKPNVLWSASQDSSYFVGENASLTLEADGGLKLRDGDSRLAWSTGMFMSTKNVTSFFVSNFADILVCTDDEVVWKSSDRPSNTLMIQKAFLPGNSLVSWTSDMNATQGQYRLEMDANRLALKFKTETYWEFVFPVNVSNSSTSFSVFCWEEIGLITLDVYTDYSQFVDPMINFVSPKNCSRRPPFGQTQRLMENAPNLTYATFVRLEVTGDLVVYTWNYTENYWYKGYNFSSLSNCFLPSHCGPYGVCNKTTGECMEICPSGGKHCNITVSSDCKAESEFRMVQGVDYFSIRYTDPKVVQFKEECTETCRANCSCKAAFLKENRCFHTHEDVQTLQTGDYVAFLKVSKQAELPRPTSTLTVKKDQSRFLGIGLGVLVPALVLLSLCLAWTCMDRLQPNLSSDREDDDMELSLRDLMPQRFTYSELEMITNNFSSCLGNGGYGSVYRGRLPEGTEVAVKKLLESNQTSQDFYAEIASLARTNHLNLVKFLGFCAEGPRKRLLVYEFMVNGSLDRWIFKDGSLSWKVKYKIATGTAQGLFYLHEECAERIIHLDLKPENVLVDSSFVPKIADFGLSKLMNREVTYLQMTSMRGTPGYLAPEYLQVGTITEKSDVFSFGVLLLEIITGCRNKSMSSEYLKTLSTLMSDEAALLRTIAYLCIQDDPDMRPSMSNVVKMMEGLIELPKAPSDSDVHFFLGYRSKVALPSSLTSVNQRTRPTSNSTPSTLYAPPSLGPR